MAKTKRSKAQKKADREYEDKRAGTRSRNWCFVLYPEDLPDDYEDKLVGTGVPMALSPLHDKDLNGDGSPKKPHRHGVMTFDGVKNCKQVKTLFGELFGYSAENVNSVIGVAIPQVCHGKVGAVRYLAHLDNPEKAQYDPAEIKGLNGFDVAQWLVHNESEILALTIEVEEFIENERITDFCVLMKRIRYAHQDWYKLVTFQRTYYFTQFIKSYRHYSMTGAASEEDPAVKVDPETGEVID